MRPLTASLLSQDLMQCGRQGGDLRQQLCNIGAHAELRRRRQPTEQLAGAAGRMCLRSGEAAAPIILVVIGGPPLAAELSMLWVASLRHSWLSTPHLLLPPVRLILRASPGGVTEPTALAPLQESATHWV